MRPRASSLVIVLLSFATLVGFTSAMRDGDQLLQVRQGEETHPELQFTPERESTDPTAPTEEATEAEHGEAPQGAQADPETSAEPGGTTAGSPEETEPAGNVDPDCAVMAPPDAAPLRVAYLMADLTGLSTVTGSSEARRDDVGTAHSEFQALFDDLNASGGLCGRQVEAQGFRYPLTTIIDPNAQLRACVQVTEDYGAQYVVDTFIMVSTPAQQCFAQRGVALVTVATKMSDERMAQLVPYVATTFPTVDAQFRALVPTLEKVGYLRGGTVGVFLEDEPDVVSAYDTILAPALRNADAEPVVVERVRHNDYGTAAASVLRFRSSRVDRVIFVGGNQLFLNFSNTAESQGYRPRYATGDYDTLAATAAVGGNPNQMRDMVAVSVCNDIAGCIVEDASRHTNDYDTPYDPARISPGQRRCFDRLGELRGRDYYRPDNHSSMTLSICEHFFLWSDALLRANDPSPAGFGSALMSLGAGYQSARTHSTDFSNGLQSGGTAYAAGVYDPDCQCWPRATDWTVRR